MPQIFRAFPSSKVISGASSSITAMAFQALEILRMLRSI